MDRAGFLNTFKEALTGKVPDDVIQDNVSYYNRYIDAQLRNGKSEEQVLTELGDPRLLARTIEDSTRYAQGDYSETTDTYETVQDADEEHRRGHWLTKLPTWLTALILVVVFAFLIVAVFSLLSYFAPLILFILMVMLVGNVIRSWHGGYR